MAAFDELIPERMLEWSNARGHNALEVRLGDVYPELRIGVSAVVAWDALPKRAHSYFSRLFPHWSDFSEVTAGELLDLRNVGRLTIKQFLRELDRRSEIGNLHNMDPNDATPRGIQEPQPVGRQIDGFDTLQSWANWRDPLGTITLRQLIEGGFEPMPVDVAEALGRVLDTSLQLPETDLRPSDPEEILKANLDERHFDVLRRRRWTEDPETLEQISESYNVTGEWVRRLQNAGLSEANRVATLVAELRWSIDYVRRMLGEAPPLAVVGRVMADLSVKFPSVSAAALLDLAGPYAQGTPGHLLANGFDVEMVLHDLEQFADDNGGLDNSEALPILAAHGVLGHSAEAFLIAVAGMRRFGDEWYAWRGGAADKAAVVMHRRSEPATVQQVIDDIGQQYSKGSVASAMSVDGRFVRTSKTHWGLAEWGRAEYTGIVDGMLARIASSGGRMDLEDLAEDMVRTFGASANSVRAFAATLEFIVERGGVRRRTATDPWPYRTEISTARGAFRVGETIRALFPITYDAFRGSGQAMPEATAAALGVRPKGEREYVDDHGSRLTVRWHASSITGPSVGSIRPFIRRVGGGLGDHVVLIFDPAAGTVSTVLLSSDLDPSQCLNEVVGSAPSASGVAKTIGISEEELFECLRSRGDDAVIDWLLSM